MRACGRQRIFCHLHVKPVRYAARYQTAIPKGLCSEGLLFRRAAIPKVYPVRTNRRKWQEIFCCIRPMGYRAINFGRGHVCGLKGPLVRLSSGTTACTCRCIHTHPMSNWVDVVKSLEELLNGVAHFVYKLYMGRNRARRNSVGRNRRTYTLLHPRIPYLVGNGNGIFFVLPILPNLLTLSPCLHPLPLH